MDVSEPDYDYIAYIDEAGDTGLNRVRPIDPVGGTEWMSIGAAVIRRLNEPLLPKWVGGILKDIGVRQRPDLHFRNLSPTRQSRTCSIMAEKPAVYFCVLSNKKNMRGYRNIRAEKKGGTQQWFYNWLCRILIERISDLVLRDSLYRYGEPRRVKFLFSTRGGHRYSQTQAYHELLKIQSRAETTILSRRVPKWEVMHYKLVENQDHRDNAGLQMADAVASAFYTAVDKLDTGPCFVKPAQLLKPRMAFEKAVGTRSKIIEDFGLVIQPYPAHTAKIDDDQRDIFKFYGYRF